MKLSVYLLLFLVGLELVLTASLSYKLMTPITGYCIIGQDSSGCGSVQNSMYGEIFGIKLGYIGFVSFLILAGVLIRDLKKKKISGLFVGLSFAGAVFALYLIYLQFFVLKQICTTCMIVDVTAVLIFVLGLMVFRKAPLVYR